MEKVSHTAKINECLIRPRVTSADRKVAESTPTFLSPSGSESSKMVLRDEQLLLECIAAGL